MKRKCVFILLIAQVIGWILMTIADYIEETSGSCGFELAITFLLPTILSLLYFFFRESLYHNTKHLRWQSIACVLSIWLGMTLIFLILICCMIDHNLWIVYQDTVGLYHMLNGVEYVFFAMFFGLLPALTDMLGEIILFILEPDDSSKSL